MSRAFKTRDPRRPTLGSRLPSGFQRLGSPRERALVLAMSGQHLAAAELVLEAILAGQPDLRTGVEADRHLATLAARYFASGDDRLRAAEIYEALGEEARAAELRAAAEQAGDVGGPPGEPAAPPEAAPPGSAPRPEKTAPRTTLIAQGASLAASGRLYEAAACYLKAGDARQGLELLVGIAESHPRYGDAARLMIRILVKHRLAEAPLLGFVLPYLRRGPRDAEEQSLFRTLRRFLEDVGAAGDVPGLRTSPVLGAPAPSAGARMPKTAEPPGSGAEMPEGPPGPGAPLHKDPRTAAALIAESPKQREDPRQLGQAETMHVALGAGGGDLPPSALGTRVEAAAPSSPPFAEPPLLRPEASATAGGLPFDPGARVDDRYVIQGVLGAGGMATVFRAWDEELEEHIALKVFRQLFVDEEQTREGLARFRQELKVSRRLYHPHLIRLYDIGVHMGYRYLTMELLEGNPLDALLGEPVPPRLGLDWVRQVAAGLAEAHRLGVIHRDIKPENIFVTNDGTLKIMDFGIAKSKRERGVTLAGTTAGTPEYMAPEQINRFSDVGGAADQYSLGVVAYQIFTGRLPFPHPDLVPLLMAHVQEPPPPLRLLNPAIAPEIEALVLQLLAKSPADRFPSCDVLVARLSALLDAV